MHHETFSKLDQRTVAISGSRRRDRPSRLASSRVPLHRVVLGEPSIRSGHQLPEAVMLPGRRGRTPTRIARRLTRQRQLTRAMTDSHRATRPTRLASGTSTQLQPFSSQSDDSPSRYQPGPATLPPSRSQSSAELRLPDRGRDKIGSLRRGERTRRTCISLVPDNPARRRDSPSHCRGRVGCKSNAWNGLGEGATGW
jgi:hypothetical protein